MATRRKPFRELSPRAQARATRIAETRYGILGGELQRRYDAGVYNPFARGNPLLRIPEEYREYAQEEESGQITVDWSDAAYDSMHRLERLEDVKEYNDARVQFHVYSIADTKVQQRMAWMTTDEIRAMASIQVSDLPLEQEDYENTRLTYDLSFDDIGYMSHSDKTDQNEWNNVFWYH
jgi:hypothetical protein